MLIERFPVPAGSRRQPSCLYAAMGMGIVKVGITRRLEDRMTRHREQGLIPQWAVELPDGRETRRLEAVWHREVAQRPRLRVGPDLLPDGHTESLRWSSEVERLALGLRQRARERGRKLTGMEPDISVLEVPELPFVVPTHGSGAAIADLLARCPVGSAIQIRLRTLPIELAPHVMPSRRANPGGCPVILLSEEGTRIPCRMTSADLPEGVAFVVPA